MNNLEINLIRVHGPELKDYLKVGIANTRKDQNQTGQPRLTIPRASMQRPKFLK